MPRREKGKPCSTHERRGMHARFWWKRQKEVDHREDVDVGRRTILKWILEK
jgi:hypothetical protein